MARHALVLALLAACPLARAAYEDAGYSARALALGSAMTAVEGDPAAFLYNPATVGSLRRAEVSGAYLRQFHLPAGETDQDLLDLAASLPLPGGPRAGTLGAAAVYNRPKGRGVERAAVLGYGSRGLWEFEDGTLELGASLKAFKTTFDEGGSAKPAATLDVGALARFGSRYAAGFSLLNVTRPRVSAQGGTADRVPATARLGVSESVRGFLIGLDLSHREPSGGHKAAASVGGGMEHWWATARRGSFAARTGLSLGERSKTWNWGLGWRRLGGEIDYAMTVPLAGTSRLGHAVTLVLRFGTADADAEYEKVLADEVRHRRSLTEALEAAEVKQWRLAEELRRLREEMELLRSRLIDKTASEAEARERMKALQERHRKAQEEFERLQEEKRRNAAKTQETLFQEDWRAYQKLKLGGAPDAVLTDQVKRLLRQYKDAGVDLSEANLELLRLLRAR